MTNLDSILKSRDITLPTKVCLVKAMVFPVVMYGYECWTIKKAFCGGQRTDAFELLEKTLAPWKKSYDQPRQHTKKQRHYFANKGPSSQGYGFSCGHVWM